MLEDGGRVGRVKMWKERLLGKVMRGKRQNGRSTSSLMKHAPALLHVAAERAC